MLRKAGMQLRKWQFKVKIGRTAAVSMQLNPPTRTPLTTTKVSDYRRWSSIYCHSPLHIRCGYWHCQMDFPLPSILCKTSSLFKIQDKCVSCHLALGQNSTLLSPTEKLISQNLAQKCPMKPCLSHPVVNHSFLCIIYVSITSLKHL